MKIPYKVFPDHYGSHVWSAMLPVHIALPQPNAPRSKRFEALIDSGAGRSMFHAEIGIYLGLDIASGILERTNGIGGAVDSYLHDIKLYLPGGPVQIKAAFKFGLPLGGLLGMNGFFEHFSSITFDSAAKTCELDRLYRP